MSKRETIEVIKQKLDQDHFTNQWLEAIKSDERKGVQRLVNRYFKRKAQDHELHEQFINMQVYERDLYQSGYQSIAGVDEVGRGPIAGPVVAACVVLPQDIYMPGINDSKKLSKEKLQYFFEEISQHAISFSVGQASVKEIDYFNIYQATKLAMKRAINNLTDQPEFLLMDAMRLDDINIEQKSLIKGDSKSISIAAASIIAKVTRDRLMKEIGEEYPMYHFDRNVGYGTSDHLEALKKYGPSPHHRRSFQPVSQYT